ncbi:hypothetical protein KKC97_12340, partial [bacterium]|nr:hypothetical protein [bacterium]
AYESALHLRRYDKAMEYLEKLWTDYGVLSVSHGSPLLAKYDPNGERNYEMSIRFQGKIEHLRELLAEQEQQDD